jgi:2-keto-4-pentenoate hydratase/2-oxohepta-3-ene-1,7-dioic acid hydratase in catechol pathway
VHLVTFRRGRGEPKPGAVWHEAVLDLGGLAKELAAQRGVVRRGKGGFPRSLLELIQGGEAPLALVREAWEYGKGLVDQQAIEELAKRKLAYPLKRVRLLAPIPHPARNVFCLGRNYADHAAERGAAVPEHPVYFTKPGTAVIGPGDDVVHHAATSELDYEVELTAVIGTGGHDISRADALKHVFGYTICWDFSQRDPWGRGRQNTRNIRKGFDTFTGTTRTSQWAARSAPHACSAPRSRARRTNEAMRKWSCSPTAPGGISWALIVAAAVQRSKACRPITSDAFGS